MRGKNVVLELRGVRDGMVHFRLHLGHRRGLPAGFLRTYCAESWDERLLRYMARCLCGQSRHHFRMKVPPYDASLCGVFTRSPLESFRLCQIMEVKGNPTPSPLVSSGFGKPTP